MLTYELKKEVGMPLYEGLYRCIREDIRTGRLAENAKLPSKRALAGHLKISKITVEGAYEQLLSEGYIRSVEKVGYFVEPGNLSTNFDKSNTKMAHNIASTNFDNSNAKTAHNIASTNFDKSNAKTAHNIASTNFDNSNAKTAHNIASTNFDNSNAKTAHNIASTNIDKSVKKMARIDLTANHSPKFPFSVWSRLQREVMLDLGEKLLAPVPNQGLLALRQAISRQLQEFRGMTVDPDNILIGAGTDFLYNLLIQLLGRDKVYAVEDPGYGKIRKIYAAGGVECVSAPMDKQGVRPDGLERADILHISPSHHFPTGIITTAQRRQALLQWARKGDRYIIEDDYDTEFRFSARPIPPMFSMDRAGQVIYMNTFSKTLASSIRISYMVLPEGLMQRFQSQLGFYSCTVPSFEQYTLARFLDGGHFEKHINRMRKLYKSRRNRVLASLPMDKCTILEENAGLHFLLNMKTDLSDAALTQRFDQLGILVHSLGSYYHSGAPQEATHTLVVNYSALTDPDIEQLEERLKHI